ncbi:MAG: YkgJ family cysteine cluster protein [Dehalococcoidia bacterium]|nr:YkgJ family cysteine cluster protein [Dehalococcoidia bacterium]
MKDDRLCTCGSGLAYGACCGRVVKEDDPIRDIRLSAYAGEIGSRRAEFCRSYTFHKREALAEISARLSREAQAAGNTLSCHQGCASCCYVYVVASLQECEAIVYYLYQHPSVLQHFQGTFQTWRVGITKIQDTFADISRLQQKRLSRTDTSEDKQEFDKALITYTQQNLPCPFLKDGSCLIYEVRPYACAGLVSTTPADWCAAGHLHHHEIRLLKANTNLDGDPPYFANPTNPVSLASMPALVYEILYYGWDFLVRVPGCAHLNDKLSAI